MKILFITNGSIGDVVISTGILRHFLRLHPEAELTVAASPAAIALFEGCPNLKALLPVVKQSWKRHWFFLWRSVKGTRWDVVIDMRSSALSWFLNAQKRVIFKGGDIRLSKRAQMAKTLELQELPPPILWTSAQAEETKRGLLPPGKPAIVLVPKSNAAFKDWPIERYTELARKMMDMPALRDCVFVIFGLPSQRDGIRPLLDALPPERTLDLIGKTSLPVASAILQSARLTIAGDSGMFHTAAALGADCMGLYGPTNDTRYAPNVPNARILKVRDFKPEEEEIKDDTLIQRLSVAQVLEAVEDWAKAWEARHSATSIAP
jgi:ADP-heptose:LPS heptosyltransferase